MVGKAVVASGLFLAATTSALADVNIEFHAVEGNVALGDTANIEVYLVSDSAADHPVSAVEVVITWEQSFVHLLGAEHNPALPLMGFPEFPAYLPLNESMTDGNAIYIALAAGGIPIIATPQGTLLGTLQFETVAETASTLIDVPASHDDPWGETIVWDGTIPNTRVTGTLTGEVIQVGDGDGETCRSDLDGDGEVGVGDFLDLLAAWGESGSSSADIDGDGVVGVGDFLALLSDWGPCV